MTIYGGGAVSLLTRKRQFSGLVVLLLSLLLQGFCFAEPATVTRISDGDTLTVTQNGEAVKVRVYGIDCPEKGQPHGEEATAFVAALLPVGSVVMVEPVERDRYGRLVGIVTLPDGSNLSETLVAQGLAWVSDKYCKREECAAWWRLMEGAENARAGLWAGEPVPPWEWRRHTRRR